MVSLSNHDRDVRRAALRQVCPERSRRAQGERLEQHPDATGSPVRALGESRGPATRRKARVVALQVLYEVDGARHDPRSALENRLTEGPLAPPARRFARRLIDGVIEHRSDIDSVISTYAPSWPISQMAMVDLNILRVAIFEIMMGGETPPKVAINEAVELGKIFGTDSSPRFVNGVLGSVMANTQPDSQ